MSEKDLDKIAQSHERALQLYPPYHPEHTVHLKALIVHLLEKPYDSARSVETRPVELSRQLLSKYSSTDAVYGAGRLEASSLLAKSLEQRYKALRQIQDIEEAVTISKENVALGPSGFAHTKTTVEAHLVQLLPLLEQRFRDSRSLLLARSNFDEIVDVHHRLTKLTTPGTLHHVKNLANLGIAFQLAFKISRDEADINEAVRLGHQVLEYRSARSQLRFIALHQLSDALCMRFDTTEDFQDSNDAISFIKEAAKLRSSRDAEYFDSLARLSDMYTQRYYKSKLPKDLDNSIKLAQKVMTSPYPSRKGRMIEIILSGSETGPSTMNGIKQNITLHSQVLEIWPMDRPDWLNTLHEVSVAFQERYKNDKNPSYLDRAVELSEFVLEMIPKVAAGGKVLDSTTAEYRTLLIHEPLEDQTIRAYQDTTSQGHLKETNVSLHLSRLLFERFCHSLVQSDLSRSAKLLQDILESQPRGHPKRTQTLKELAEVLKTDFMTFGDVSDITRAIEIQEEILTLCLPNSRDMTFCLDILAHTHFVRYSSFGESLDLEKAIDFGEKAVQMDPSDYTIARMVATYYDRRADLLKRQQDINRSKELLRQAGGPCLCYPCASTMDIEQGITLRSQVLETWSVDHPDRLNTLYELSVAFVERYKKNENPSDLDKALKLLEYILEMIPKADGKDLDLDYIGLNRTLMIGLTLASRRQPLSKKEAIGAYEDAITGCFQGHPKKANVLLHLFDISILRCQHSKHQSDLSRSIELLGNVLDSLPNGHPKRKTTVAELFFTSLIIFLDHKIRNGGLDDSDKSSETWATKLVEDFTSLWQMLTSSKNNVLNHVTIELHLLTIAISMGFLAFENPLDLEKAINFGERAMTMDPSNTSSMTRVSLLYNARGTMLKSQQDIDRSQELLTASLQLRVSKHAQDEDAIVIPDSLYGDSTTELFALQIRRAIQESEEYDSNSRDLDLASSILSFQQNLQDSGLATFGEMRYFAGFHDMLVSTTGIKLDTAQTKQEFDDAFADLATVTKQRHGWVDARFNAAMKWVAAAIRPVPFKHSWLQAAKAYQTAIELLPQMCWIEFGSSARLKILKPMSTLGCDAAAWTLLHQGDLSLAVEHLEHARATVLTHSLHIRTKFNDLPGEFSNKLMSLSEELRSIEAVDVSVSDIPSTEILHRRQVQTDWANTIEEVRKIKGFEHFLLPKPYKELAEAAKHGPVVILVGSKHQCSAVVLQDEKDPVHIPLDIDYRHLWVWNMRLSTALTGLGYTRDRGPDQANGKQNPQDVRKANDFDREIRRILFELWNMVVWPIFDDLKLTESKTRRLWWCPTGPFVFLPLHAASSGRQSTMQYVISSYTPNLSFLIAARKAVHASASHTKLCVVCQPNVQGETVLSKAQEEASTIYSVIPPEFLARISGISEIPPGGLAQAVKEDIENTTTQNVLDRIQEVSFVHFACHGTQNIKAPLESALLLHDGPLTISRIQSIHRAAPASLAYLSACRSGMGDISQPDEAIHMAAAMLAAGFRSIVATMWPMVDDDGPVIAEAFYKALMHEGSLDGGRSALALHEAVQKLKASDVPLARWMQFVHFGA